MRKYDITERLRRKNELPIVVIGDQTFTVKAKMTNYVIVMHEAKEIQKLADSEDAGIEEVTNKIYEIIGFVLGDKAVEHIKSMDLTVEATLDLMLTSITMIGGGDLKDEDELEKK